MFDQASTIELMFWGCALTGSFFLIARLLLMMALGLGDHDAAGAHDAGMGHDVSAHHGADVAFKLISINTITAFVAMFGWAGLAGLKEFGVGRWSAFAIAVVVGALTMAFTAYLFKLALSLASTGDTFQIDKALGQVAEVYQRIPVDGSGRIHVTVGGMLREVDAVSEAKEEIASFTRVSIERVVDGSTVAVKRL